MNPPTATAPVPSVAHEAWLLLAATPGLARRLPRVLESLGDPLRLWALSDRQWQSLGLGADARRWLAHPDRSVAAPALAWLRADAPAHHAPRHLLTFTDPRYPPLLRAIADPPVCLLACGALDEALARPALAMVGSRRASASGAEHARALAAALAASGLTIVSGLAQGIDAAAHRGALDAGGPTVAVLATGPDRVYPAGHASLARGIRRQGCLLSEFAPGTPPRRHHFPQRNRIIAGMCVGTLVVEAAQRSGSLITAQLAAEAGREVLAVPGSVRNPQTRGCHQLLREGAVLVEEPADVVEALTALPGCRLAAPVPVLAGIATAPSAADTLPSESRLVVSSLGHDPASIEELGARTGLTAGSLCSILAALEVQGLVQRQADGRFVSSPHSEPGSR